MRRNAKLKSDQTVAIAPAFIVQFAFWVSPRGVVVVVGVPGEGGGQ